MYINIKLFEKSGLKNSDLVLLCAIKTVETKFLIENLTEQDYNRFKTLNLIKHVKTKKKGEHLYESLRIDKKGEDLLTSFSYEGAVDEESVIIADWLIKIYKSKSGGIVKNKTEIKRRVHWFKTITHITGNKLAILLQCYIQDTYNDQDGYSVKEFMENNPRGVLSNMCDNICFSPSSVFDKHYTLDKSPLFSYYEDNLEYVQSAWKSKGIE